MTPQLNALTETILNSPNDPLACSHCGVEYLHQLPPEGDSDITRILFSCESCDSITCLTVRQHKGCTYFDLDTSMLPLQTLRDFAKQLGAKAKHVAVSKNVNFWCMSDKQYNGDPRALGYHFDSEYKALFHFYLAPKKQEGSV